MRWQWKKLQKFCPKTRKNRQTRHYLQRYRGENCTFSIYPLYCVQEVKDYQREGERMNLREIRSGMKQFDEMLFPGLEVEAAGVRMLAAGIFREGKKVQILLMAEQEESQAEKQKKFIKMEKKRRKGTLTKREELLMELEGQDFWPPGLVRGIQVKGREYALSSGSGGGLEEYNLDGRLLLCQLLNSPVSFGFLEERDISLIQYGLMGLRGEYDKIPFSEEDLKTLELMTESRHYHIPVKQKMKVSLGPQKEKRRKFFCEALQKEVSYDINNVMLEDIWTSFKEKYDQMKQESLFSSEEEYEMFLEHLREICPPGMRNLVIEYECEEASLEFYTKEQLKEKVKIKNGATAFFLAGNRDRKIGRHQKQLKSCLIQYPVNPEIQEAEIELLGASIVE